MIDRLVSPEETTALMTESSSAGEYSFRRPPAYMAEREGIFDQAAEVLAAGVGRRLSKLLRRDVTLTWTQRLEEPLAPPSRGSLVFQLGTGARLPHLILQPDLVPLLADLLLGAAEPGEARPLTDLERRVLTPVALAVTALLRAAGLPAGEPRLLEEKARAKNAAAVVVAPDGDGSAPAAPPPAAEIAATDGDDVENDLSFIVLTGSVALGNRSGGLILALPPLQARRLVAPTALEPGARLAPQRIASLPARLQVGLTGGNLRLREVTGLTPGDVVRLDQAGDAPVDILIHGRRVGRGRLSVRGGRRAIVMEDTPSVRPQASKGERA